MAETKLVHPAKIKVKQGLVYRIDTSGRNGLYSVANYHRTFMHTPAKHVMHYATSGFEGILAVPASDGHLRVPTLMEHIERMLKTMDFLLISRPETIDKNIEEFDKAFPNREKSLPIPLEQQKYLSLTNQQILYAILTAVRENVRGGHVDANKLIYIRPNFYRDERIVNGEVVPGLGVSLLAHEAVFEITVVNVPPYLASAPADGARVLVFEKALFKDTRTPQSQEYYNSIVDGLQSTLRKVKSEGNYALGGVAKNLALSYGCDEALITDPKGLVLEGGKMYLQK